MFAAARHFIKTVTGQPVKFVGAARSDALNRSIRPVGFTHSRNG
jgi:hypothetical protein